MTLIGPFPSRGGSVFAKSCSQTKEPEDVTVGLVVGAVLNLTLSRTELINTHGLWLATTVHSNELAKQVYIHNASVNGAYND